MTDTVLIQWGMAHEIFARRTLEEMARRRHPDLVAQMVEVDDDSVVIGDVWDGRRFTKPVIDPPPPPPRDPIAELDALKAILRTKGVIDATASARNG